MHYLAKYLSTLLPRFGQNADEKRKHRNLSTRVEASLDQAPSVSIASLININHNQITGSSFIFNKSLFNYHPPSLGAGFFFLFFVSFASSTPPTFIPAANNEKQVEALLAWKSSLEDHSQSQLSSWHGNNSCNFVVVTCNDYGSITHLNLSYPV